MGWQNIPFDTDYNYSGSGSIEVLVENLDGSYGFSGPYFAYALPGSNRSVTNFDDGAFPTTGGSVYNAVYLMRFNKTVTPRTSANPTFNDITIANADVTLADPMDITGTLTLTAGDIISDATNKLTLKIWIKYKWRK